MIDGLAMDLCPADVLGRRLGRAPFAVRAWSNPAVRAMASIRAANAREYVAQQNAIDAPFQDLARAKFFASDSCAFAAACASASEASGAARGGALTKLDSSKTNDTHAREVVEVDVFASRVRRLQKAVQNSAHMLDADAHVGDVWQRWRRLFVTLTYADVSGWRPNHINAFTKCVREWFRRRDCRCRIVWVLEMQKRGAVHYHCMIWVRSKDYFPNPHARGWWPHGFAHVLSSKVQINRPVAYMAKYASKCTVDQAMSIPKGARMHGVCGLKPEGRRVIRFWRAPLFVRDALGGAADIRKVPGGYMDRFTGEMVISPWHVTVLPSGRVFAWRDVPAQLEIAA
ncbi:rolling circle replication-associated protein [Dyella psychrodurans]|uniref:Replication initiation protein n=1 Tax=Dyella psychrodurans TaxID=1927960 RepID=A0A370XCT9_9GAMM|nr:replication initiation protein [Dyella psychrodurans]RDS86122.1 replication initiation protein [Dyella psychrodurans]